METYSQITDVSGIRVGHWTDLEAATGCTVILTESGAVAGVDVRGDSPGTRETDLLKSTGRVKEVQALLLSGGSAFGLAAADGVMKYLEDHSAGFSVGQAVIPIVPSAILFDLNIGDGSVRPTSMSGYEACRVAGSGLFAVGNVGAGTGATVAKTSGMKCAIKSGLGSSSIRLKNGIVVGSLMVVNAIGSIHDPETGILVAGPRNAKGIMSSSFDDLVIGQSEYVVDVGGNTTIGVLATNADLSEKEVSHMATIGHDGLAMAVRPAHLAGDGDAIFSLATGHCGKTVGITEYNQILAAGVLCTFRAILNAVINAESLAGYPSVKDM